MGDMPVEWTKGIINPIPKPDEKDARILLTSHLSVAYKKYTDILNLFCTKARIFFL